MAVTVITGAGDLWVTQMCDRSHSAASANAIQEKQY
jgi:hypothetical protein